MRIVHDITVPMSVSAGAKPYSNAPGWMGYSSLQCDVLVVEDCAENHPELPPQMFGRDEAIYIEGDSRYLIPALEQALSMLRQCEEAVKGEIGERRSTGCPDNCSGIERFHGNHLVSCPKHPNHEYFMAEANDGKCRKV